MTPDERLDQITELITGSSHTIADWQRDIIEAALEDPGPLRIHVARRTDTITTAPRQENP